MKVPQLVKNTVKDIGLRRPLLLAGSARFRKIDKLARNLAALIRTPGFERIYQKHKGSDDGYKKYLLEFDSIIEFVAGEVMNARVTPAPPKLRVFDVGCGPGYFLYAVRSLGHDVLGLDIEKHEVFNDLIKEMTIPRVLHRVEAMKTLPDLGRPFDLITALGIAFDLHRSEEDTWGSVQWEYFLKDCLTRLNPGGRICMRFNPASTRDFDFVPNDVAEMLRNFPGGKLSDSKEYFDAIKPK